MHGRHGAQQFARQFMDGGWPESVVAGADGCQAHAALRANGLVFHGLRKSAVVFLLEAGCTDAEVSAITGQSLDTVAHYARQVNQRRLAASAVLKWEADEGARARA